MIVMCLLGPLTQHWVGATLAPFRAAVRSSFEGFFIHLNRSVEGKPSWYSPSSLFNLTVVTICVYRNDNVIMSPPVARGRWVYLTWKSTVWLRSCLGPWWWCRWSWWACSTLLAVGTCRSFAFCCSSLKLCPLGAISNFQHPFTCMFWTFSLAWFLNWFLSLFLFRCSLRVNLDMGKIVFSWMIKKDSKIPGTMVRTSTIPEQLGRISYLLTDKTGKEMADLKAVSSLRLLSRALTQIWGVVQKICSLHTHWGPQGLQVFLLNCWKMLFKDM